MTQEQHQQTVQQWEEEDMDPSCPFCGKGLSVHTGMCAQMKGYRPVSEAQVDAMFKVICDDMADARSMPHFWAETALGHLSADEIIKMYVETTGDKDFSELEGT